MILRLPLTEMAGNPRCLGSPLNLTAAQLKIGFLDSEFAGARRVEWRETTTLCFFGTDLLRRLEITRGSSSTSGATYVGTCARLDFGDSGPSLSRGRREPGSTTKEERINNADDGEAQLPTKRYVKGADIDRAALTRVYNVAALRVPSDESEEFAYKLKGHLLNWPRIKNVARVAGDQLDEDTEKLLWDGQRKQLVVRDSVRNAVFPDESLPPALQNNDSNDRLRKKELKRRFPHLEALSRPTRAARFLKHNNADEDELHSYKSNMVEAKGITRSMWEEKAVVVEIVESQGQEFGTIESFQALLEQGKQPKQYQGSTRLLLLDEGLAGKPLSELPKALQVVVSAGSKRGLATRQLVQTRLILSYDYWPVDEILQELLPKDVVVQSTFDKLGHIARLHLQEKHYSFRHVVAQVILDRHKPRIRSVVCDVSSTSRSYDGPQLELLAGNSRLVTSLIRNGTLFKIDLAKGSWPKIAVTGEGTQNRRANLGRREQTPSS